MASPPNITNIPAPRVEFIDKRTGLMAREWYRFFLNLFTLTGSGQAPPTPVEDVLVGPPPQDLSEVYGGIEANELTPYPTVQVTLADLQALAVAPPVPPFTPADLQALAVTPPVQSFTAAAPPQMYGSAQAQYDELTKTVQGLLVAPVQPEVQDLHLGTFYDTTDQTAAAINTAYAMTFDTTVINRGVRIGSPTSRVYTDNVGVYNIAFSVQATSSSASSHLMYIWLRKNGNDVPWSATRVEFKGSGNDKVLAWNFMEQFAAGDYFELMWSVTDTAVQIVKFAAAAPVPDIPSIILTVNQVNL